MKDTDTFKYNPRGLRVSLCLLATFVLWTLLVLFIDVRPIGPEGSRVGFAGLNELFHGATGVHMQLYEVTDRLALVPILICAGFGLLGLVQLIKRRNLWRVDHDILALGVFYIIVMATFTLFQIAVVNYRPILIDGQLEPAYPSSTTILTMCVMMTAVIQFNNRIKNKPLRTFICALIVAFTAFVMIARIISGVHWITDIIGGALFSSGVVLMYHSLGIRSHQ